MDIKVRRGDLWTEHAAGRKVVVTTNIGWDPRSFRNNMGAGMALAAATRYPNIDVWYGRICALLGNDTPVIDRSRSGIVFLPVKPLLDVNDPERSWDQPASLTLIARMLRMLPHVATGDVSLALPGCGNGGLDPRDVMPLVNKYLDAYSKRFRVVDQRDDV